MWLVINLRAGNMEKLILLLFLSTLCLGADSKTDTVLVPKTSSGNVIIRSSNVDRITTNSSGTTTISGPMTLNNTATFGSTVNITGATTLSSSLTIGGNTTSDSNYGTISSVTNSAYYEGSFTATFTGPATFSPTVRYVKVGKMVNFYITGISGACSGTSTGFSTAVGVVPSNIRPTRDQAGQAIQVANGGAWQSYPGVIAVYADGSMAIGLLWGNAGSFTANGTNCGWNNGLYTFNLL